MSRPSKKAEAKSSKSGRAQVNVRTTPQLLAQIDQARQDTSRSEFIVQAIEAYLGIEPPSPQTTATVQSLVDAAVEQAIHSVTRTLEERLKALGIRLSTSDVDENVDAPVDSGDAPFDEVARVGVDELIDVPVDSGDAPFDEVGRVGVDAPVDSLGDLVDAPVEGEIQATSAELELEEATRGDRHASPESEDGVEAGGDSGDDAVEGSVQATSGESGLAEVAGGDRHGSPESDLAVDAAGDSVDEAVEGKIQATSAELELEEATRGDRTRSQESKQGVDQSLDFTTQGLSGRELASRLSVSPSSITTNRKKKGTNAFAKWTSQQDPEAIAWSYQKERYYPVEPKG